MYFHVCSVEVDTLWGRTRDAQKVMSKLDLHAILQRLRPNTDGSRLPYFAQFGPCIDQTVWFGSFSGAGKTGYPRWRGRSLARILHDAFVQPGLRPGTVIRHTVPHGGTVPCHCSSPFHCCIGSAVAVETAWTTQRGYESVCSVASEVYSFVCEEAAMALRHDYPSVDGTKAKRKAYLRSRWRTLQLLANSVNVGYDTILSYVRATPDCDLRQGHAHRLARRLHITAYRVVRESGLNLCRLRPRTELFDAALRCIRSGCAEHSSVWAAVLHALRSSMQGAFAYDAESAVERRWDNPTKLEAAMAFVKTEGDRMTSMLQTSWWLVHSQTVERCALEEQSLRKARTRRHTVLVKRSRQKSV